jgi:hypothetical protein
MGDNTTTGPKYPNVKVRLVGRNGNAFLILGRVKAALKAGGVPAAEVTRFFEEATAGDYDHLLATCMNWVDVE